MWGGVGWGGMGWGGVGVGLLDFYLSTSEHINMNVKASGDMHSSDCSQRHLYCCRTLSVHMASCPGDCTVANPHHAVWENAIPPTTTISRAAENCTSGPCPWHSH